MTNALTTPSQTLDLISAAMANLGITKPPEPSNYGRARMQGLALELKPLDGEPEVIYPKGAEEPLIYALLRQRPRNHQAMWIDRDVAEIIGRDLSPWKENPNYKGYFCKSYDDDPEQNPPNQRARKSESGDDCETCPVRPFIKKGTSPVPGDRKCSWRSDISFIRYERGQNGWDLIDDTEYEMSLSTSGVIELQGIRGGNEGVVSDQHFYRKLAVFMVEHLKPDLSDGAQIQAAVAEGMLALEQGRVIVGIQIKNASNQDKTRTWTVPVLTPIDIMDAPAATEAPPQVAAEAAKPVGPTTDAADYDDLPF